MKLNEYQKLAMRTSNKELNKGEHVINGAMGIYKLAVDMPAVRPYRV